MPSPKSVIKPSADSFKFERGWRSVIEETREVVGDGPTYVSFDVDGLDPVYAPGTGTPEVGGFSTIEAQLMIRALSGLDFIGGDVVEVAPPFDPSGNTALVGATMMFEILCVVAEARTARSWPHPFEQAGQPQTRRPARTARRRWGPAPRPPVRASGRS